MVRLLAPKKTESLETNSKHVVPLSNCGFDGQELGKKRQGQNCYDVHGIQLLGKGIEMTVENFQPNSLTTFPLLLPFKCSGNWGLISPVFHITVKNE